jgi:hypothetical protein
MMIALSSAYAFSSRRSYFGRSLTGQWLNEKIMTNHASCENNDLAYPVSAQRKSKDPNSWLNGFPGYPKMVSLIMLSPAHSDKADISSAERSVPAQHSRHCRKKMSTD